MGELLALRRRYLAPHLKHIGHGSFRAEGTLLHLEWKLGDAASWQVPRQLRKQ